MPTLYPSRIDGYSQIRIVRDKIGEILAKDHNDICSAVISIEKTLGLNPQGSFPTVVGRLDDAYAIIKSHADGNAPRHTDSHIVAYKKLGTIDALNIGTTRTQVQQLLGYINGFCANGGASSIGATGFATIKNNYVAYSETIQDQIKEVGGFLDRNVDFLKIAFNSYVVSGMLVSSTNFTDIQVNITQGFISCQGMMIRSATQSGLTLLASPGDGIYYVYASRSSNTVVFGAADDLSSILLEPNAIILLAEVILDSGTVTVNDLRRFGVFYNDKNGFTVGSTLVNANDGYGCDFLSLKSAVKYLTLMKSSGKFINQSKISLVNDIVIDSDLESEINLLENAEIDGCGNSILYSSSKPLFVVDADNVVIKNLTIVPLFTNPYHTGSFVLVAEHNSVTNLKITDCFIKSSGTTSLDLEYFMFIGNQYGTTTVNNSLIRNNNVAIYHAGIGFEYSSAMLNNTMVEGNRFYQYDAYATSNMGIGITVGSYCKVIGNFITGGFNTGILVNEGVYTDVQGNTIVGSQDEVYYMNNGILLKNTIVGVVSDCVFSNNIIRGINLYGINCVYGSGYNTNIIVDSNLIDNKVNHVTQPINMVAIECGNNVNSIVSNNIILYPGLATHAIDKANNILGNYIYCTPKPSEAYDVFSIYVEDCPNSFISQNIIVNCDGSGISMNSGCVGTTVIDNLIHNIFSETSFSESSYCIYANSDYMSVINNTIIGSELEAINRTAISCTGNKSIICGNAIHNINGTGIISFGSQNVISNNILTEVEYGIDCSNSSSCLVKDNFILTDTNLSFISSKDAVFGIGRNSVVEGNYIYGFGQDVSTSKTIYISGIEGVCVLNNFIISCKGKGIDCLNSTKSKISGNYIFVSYTAIYAGDDSEICDNMIFSPALYGIRVTELNNHVHGNIIFNSLRYGIYVNSGTNCTIVGNYIYNCLWYGITVSNTLQCLITGNCVVSNQETKEPQGNQLIRVSTSANSSIVNNCLIDINTSNDPLIQTFGIYGNHSQNSIINSNKILSAGTSYMDAIHLIDSSDSMICNNYIFNPGNLAINLIASISSSDYLINGNYIYESELSNGAISIDEGVLDVNIFNNQIHMLNSSTNYPGISLGNTSYRKILLSSNVIRMVSSQKAVDFSGTGIKLIGNIAIGGTAPDSVYWDTGYLNSNLNNVYSVS